MALEGMATSEGVSLAAVISSGEVDETSARNVWRDASRYGCEAAVTKGRQRKCVNGGFFFARRFLLLPWRLIAGR
jgi:hypothetical protein